MAKNHHTILLQNPVRCSMVLLAFQLMCGCYNDFEHPGHSFDANANEHIEFEYHFGTNYDQVQLERILPTQDGFNLLIHENGNLFFTSLNSDKEVQGALPIGFDALDALVEESSAYTLLVGHKDTDFDGLANEIRIMGLDDLGTIYNTNQEDLPDFQSIQSIVQIHSNSFAAILEGKDGDSVLGILTFSESKKSFLLTASLAISGISTHQVFFIEDAIYICGIDASNQIWIEKILFANNTFTKTWEKTISTQSMENEISFPSNKAIVAKNENSAYICYNEEGLKSAKGIFLEFSLASGEISWGPKELGVEDGIIRVHTLLEVDEDLVFLGEYGAKIDSLENPSGRIPAYFPTYGYGFIGKIDKQGVSADPCTYGKNISQSGFMDGFYENGRYILVGFSNASVFPRDTSYLTTSLPDRITGWMIETQACW